jgi:serine protease Do
LSLTVAIADRSKLSADNGTADNDTAAPTESDAGDTKLGIKVDSLPAQLASKIGIKGGVIVTSLRPGSFADEINLAKGDVITAINRHAITDQSSYSAIVSTLKSGDDVVFEIRYTSSAAAAAGPAFVYGTLP